mmetsp:Transcript_70947/g.117892  ORF Transcript_70947/g.117892 Transcript_70947/m.117892 type:complete len:235 (+) Transcript_70947:623-1327(+)
MPPARFISRRSTRRAIASSCSTRETRSSVLFELLSEVINGQEGIRSLDPVIGNPKELEGIRATSLPAWQGFRRMLRAFNHPLLAGEFVVVLSVSPLSCGGICFKLRVRVTIVSPARAWFMAGARSPKPGTISLFDTFAARRASKVTGCTVNLVASSILYTSFNTLSTSAAKAPSSATVHTSRCPSFSTKKREHSCRVSGCVESVGLCKWVCAAWSGRNPSGRSLLTTMDNFSTS